jgi:hypothetical protein
LIGQKFHNKPAPANTSRQNWFCTFIVTREVLSHIDGLANAQIERISRHVKKLSSIGALENSVNLVVFI